MLDVHGPVDQWSDTPDILDDDQSLGDNQGDLQQSSPLPDAEDVRDIKVTTAAPKTADAPVVDSSVRNASSAQPGQGHSEAASLQSLPVVHVPTGQSSPARPSTAGSPQSTEFVSAHYEALARIATPTDALRDRQARRRSGLEAIRSPNRISGFFSNLIHRRDTITRPTAREERATTPGASQSEPESRAQSPARPVTPPPPLPSPSLHELGLSLTAVTSDLSPSHFSSSPSNGAFLGPHYLLLCHAQGLDVLPLISPPAIQPYALVRRVSFKSVVVMEHRGVLVAIAGRRDGVRVYALEELKKAVEWRIELEIRKEQERTRKEVSRRIGSGSSSIDHGDSSEKKGKLSTPPVVKSQRDAKPASRPPVSSVVTPKKPRPPTMQPLPSLRQIEQPPPYTSASDARPALPRQRSAMSVNISRSRQSSISLVVVPQVPPPVPSVLNTGSNAGPEHQESKAFDWLEGSSDDEAIDMLTAGPSGSRALDERTSSIPPTRSDDDVHAGSTMLPIRSRTMQSRRGNRPANLDLALPPTSPVPAYVPSPSPTLLTIRQTLHNSPQDSRTPQTRDRQDAPEADPDDEEDDDVATVPGERITLVQALLESRLPDLPPAGSLQPQEPILLASSPIPSINENRSPLTPSFINTRSPRGHNEPSPQERRRRWSVLGSIFASHSFQNMGPSPSALAVFDSPLGSPVLPTSPFVLEEGRPLARSLTNHSPPSSACNTLAPRPSTSGGVRSSHSHAVPPVPSLHPSSSHSRLLPRILSTAFSSRRSDDRLPTFGAKNVGSDSKRSNAQSALTPHAPPPKLEYVKLPGTKGALMIKAVETQKKSFLAILCGENGEKVELFAGTYRTALGLSRTFILPDSPKSLELQLQGDDLVEVFLVFSQNVFGLEPATVRVREVRIGRAERRAARRRARARGIRSGHNEVFDADTQNLDDEEMGVNIVGVSLSGQDLPSALPSRSNSRGRRPESYAPSGSMHEAAVVQEELIALASSQIGPYTTFQQLSFTPNFPLATIADEYIIPPTYPDFLGYRAEHEPDAHGDGNVDLATIQFNPPGLPMPAPAPPSRWFYRDPRGVTHGPWKASLMQTWYKDGLLPPDLPVRKEDEKEFILLKDLRQQCLDPVHPFRSAAPLPTVQLAQPLSDASKPLLPPISLLVQPRHFGPPPLFFSSRGGHSTSIVDARGRAVLKGRFVWSADEVGDSRPLSPRMGDVKRLEAFDVKDRSVIVALRQGGLEAMDFGDALFRPADESRTVLPHFLSSSSNTNRRGPFVWKIGTSIDSTTGGTALSFKPRTGAGKKASYPLGKSPSRSEFGGLGDGDAEATEEVIFLGRNGDELYLCERNVGAFRILKLCPDVS
ncbi:hypothetical protein F5I97DRAFT_1813476 [Phlebopus sp. FC_14]|nr:hypothetical protein F5I97DRAFT_1813476 [Phlebopus sp. FC_14]